MASSFNAAFAAARRAGKKTFTWNGKSYTTETKDDQRRQSRTEKRQAQVPKSNPRRRHEAKSDSPSAKAGRAAGRAVPAKSETPKTRSERRAATPPKSNPRRDDNANLPKPTAQQKREKSEQVPRRESKGGRARYRSETKPVWRLGPLTINWNKAGSRMGSRRNK